MSDDHHEWQIGATPPWIRPHSLAKHRVIEQYLTRYVEVLTADVRIPEFYLTLIDGFAGGGDYLDSRTREVRPGSPLLMLKAMQESAAIAQSKRSKGFRLDVDFIFVEKTKETFAYLKQLLEQSEFGPLVGDKVKLVNDEFVNQVSAIIAHVQKRARGNRAILLLDQCGYSKVPFSSIFSILSNLENAEIILTFATDSLIDYLSQHDSMQKTLESIGLELNKDQIQSAKQQADWRRTIQVMLHHQIYVNSGARYYTPFFIRSKDAHRDYWLIHLSNHSRARDVMVELHWIENTNFAHFGGPGLAMLGYNQDDDVQIVGQRLPFPEFRFDEMARSVTTNALLIDLPERLAEFKEGISFEQLFSRFTNETPATSEIIKAVLAMMLQEGMVEIRDRTGSVTRQVGVQHRSDVIKPARQRRLFLPES